MQAQNSAAAEIAEAWMRPAEMATRLGVTERTVRNMVNRGELQRTEIDGKAYVRAASGNAERRSEDSGSRFRGGSFQEPSGSEGGAESTPAALVVAEMGRLANALAQASADRAEALILADVATRDLEAERQRRIEVAEMFDLEKHRAERLEKIIGRIAALPWYAFRKRAELRSDLEDLTRHRLRA